MSQAEAENLLQVNGSWVIAPPQGRPKATVHFLGGAFAGASPQLIYPLLLQLLARAGYTVISTPYAVTFKHLAAASSVHQVWYARGALGHLLPPLLRNKRTFCLQMLSCLPKCVTVECVDAWHKLRIESCSHLKALEIIARPQMLGTFGLSQLGSGTTCATSRCITMARVVFIICSIMTRPCCCAEVQCMH